MSCDLCSSSKSAQDMELLRIRKEAKNYAIENKKDAAIYKEAGEWKYAELQFAIASGFSFVEIISQYS